MQIFCQVTIKNAINIIAETTPGLMLRKQSAVQRCHRLMHRGKQLEAAACPLTMLKRTILMPTYCTTALLLLSE